MSPSVEPTAPPGPVKYISTGYDVTSLVYRNDHLLVGNVEGLLQVFSCSTWDKVQEVRVGEKGVLWVDIADNLVVIQTRFSHLMLYRWENFRLGDQMANFYLPHTGFCSGLVLESSPSENVIKSIMSDKGLDCSLAEEERESNSSEIVLACPTDQAKLMVIRIVVTHEGSEPYMRPVTHLSREDQGTLMAVAKAGNYLLLLGYESGEVVMWDWKESKVVVSVSLTSSVGTVMGLAWDIIKSQGLVGGSEARLVVVDKNLVIVRDRELTNPGVGEVVIREDSRLAVTGGWDGRLRLFSWKVPEKLRPLAVLQFHNGAVEVVSWGKVGRRYLMAAGGKGGKISFWDIYNT